MPESAARINPLRPRVCTIRLCLGEPPLRGARVRAGSLALYTTLTYTRTFTAQTLTYTHTCIRIYTYTLPSWRSHVYLGGVETRVQRHGSPSVLLDPCGYPIHQARGLPLNPKLSTTGLAMFPNPRHDWSQIRRTCSPIRRLGPRPVQLVPGPPLSPASSLRG